MHPLMKHREKMRPTQPKMTTANQPVIFKHVLEFCVLYAIENSLVNLKLFGTMFSIHLWVKRQRAACRLPMTREWLLRLPAWGGKNEMLQSVEAQSRESWRRDKNVSFMPTGVLTLLQAAIAFCQERELKGHSTNKDFHSLFHHLPSYPARTSFMVRSNTR